MAWEISTGTMPRLGEPGQVHDLVVAWAAAQLRRVGARRAFDEDVLLYTVGWGLISAAAEDINQAIKDGAFRVGEQAGLPLHHFSLEHAPAAHAAVENGAVGKVLITVAGE